MSELSVLLRRMARRSVALRKIWLESELDLTNERKRVKRLTDALTQIAKGSCDWQEREESNNCLEDFPGRPDNWCESCTAREALAAGPDAP